MISVSIEIELDFEQDSLDEINPIVEHFKKWVEKFTEAYKENGVISDFSVKDLV